MSKRINIIGSGWLALPLAQHLQQQGHQLLLTTTHQEKIKKIKATGIDAITYELGDQLSNPEQLFAADVLIIAITSKDVSAFDVLMDQLSEQDCHHLILISSTSVYSNNGATHDESSTALNHASPLLAVEQLIRQHPKATIIRFAGLVGPDRHPGRFFKQGKPVNNPEAPVNLIHLEDCIGIIDAVIVEQAWGEVFNGCADNHPKKGEYYQQMAQLSGHPVPELGIENNTGSNKIIDNTKVKQQMTYTFKYPNVFDFKFD